MLPRVNFTLDNAVEHVKVRPVILPEATHGSSSQGYLRIGVDGDIALVGSERGRDLGKNQVSVFAHRLEQFALVDGQGGRFL
jgi:hypothetical protein